MTCASACLLAAVTVGTWNGEWFPSGRAEHRAAPEIEAATISAAGKMLRAGIDAADPAGTNGVILCLNEMRGPKAAKELCAATGLTNLTVAVITAYRRRDRFDMQQDVVATTLPVVSASWSKWKNSKADTPPRGYAYAQILVSPTVTATVYAVHLKSNYGQTTDELARRNRRKRALAVEQILSQEKKPRSAKKAKAFPVVVAGDFNADKWSDRFAEDLIFKAFADAGFADVLELLDAPLRVTYPGRGKWGNGALDYIMVRGLDAASTPTIISAEGISDHNPVFVVLE